LDGKAISSGRDRRKNNAFNGVFLSQIQGIAVTGGKQFFFFSFSAGPNRTDSVNNEFCRQIISFGNLGFTCSATA
jgi:hypothetical protein